MTNVPQKRNSEELTSAIKIDADAVRSHLDELVRSTVEETLNNLLDAEADQRCWCKDTSESGYTIVCGYFDQRVQVCLVI